MTHSDKGRDQPRKSTRWGMIVCLAADAFRFSAAGALVAGLPMVSTTTATAWTILLNIAASSNDASVGTTEDP